MFTGLIQALGKVRSLGQDQLTISVSDHGGSLILQDLAIGDSVAVDGVCLTVEKTLPDGFIATASPETLAKTNLGQHSQDADYANLETSLRVGSKIGGHFVTGHVDGVGVFLESKSTEQAWEMYFGTPQSHQKQWHQKIARYLVSKGSIAVNGISLTVAECESEGNWFMVSVIPHTYHHTNLSHLKPGALVNLEGDILGKYVERLLGWQPSRNIQNQEQDISIGFLAENGYL